MNISHWSPKKIVKIIFQRDPETYEIDHLAPFTVTDRSGLHSGIYEDEPLIFAEVESNTEIAYCEAEWENNRWVFGHRVHGEHW